jgi:hypothetical protein
MRFRVRGPGFYSGFTIAITISAIVERLFHQEKAALPDNCLGTRIVEPL